MLWLRHAETETWFLSHPGFEICGCGLGIIVNPVLV